MGVFCVQAEEALLTVLVLLLCAGRFVWAALEWMRSNATRSSRTTSGPLTTSERVSVCMFLNLVYVLKCRCRFPHFPLFPPVTCSFPPSHCHSSVFACTSYHVRPIPLQICFFSALVHSLFPSPEPLSLHIWYTCSPYAHILHYVSGCCAEQQST